MTAATAPLNFQGIQVDPQGVNPQAFFKLTRRKSSPEQARAYAGLGGVENLPVRKSDILSIIKVRFSGTLVVATPSGTCSTTAAWPYGLNKNTKLTANGQSNLIDCSGPGLKAREFQSNPDMTDRGIVRSSGGVNIQSGTLSRATENWGVGQSQTAIAAGSYPVELEWVIPVAEDEKDLTGAVFCQTSSMDINLNIQWANAADLFTLTGGATATLTGQVIMETEKFSIPVAGGLMIVPDLSLFHSIVETRTQAISNGENQVRLIGQGTGKQLLRLTFRTLNGVNQVPLPVNAVNYGNQSWMYGTSDKPETYQDGTSLRMDNERNYGTDIGGPWGYMCHEFAAANAFRDTVDMGQTSELRLSTTIQNGVALVGPNLEYIQETVFAAGG